MDREYLLQPTPRNVVGSRPCFHSRGPRRKHHCTRHLVGPQAAWQHVRTSPQLHRKALWDRWQPAPACCKATKESTDRVSTQAVEQVPQDQEIQDSSVQELEHVQSPASVWLPQREPPDSGRTRVRLGFISFVASGRWSGGFRAVMRIPRYLLKLTVFKTQQIVLGNSLFKLIAVFAASVPAIVVGGAAYRATSGKTLLDGIANVYGAIYKIPGVTVLGEINPATDTVMNFFWLGGSFTFAVLLGVVTDDITVFVDNVRKGNFPVVADNHTLILNWNAYTLPLLRQISVSRQERADIPGAEGPVVILSDRPKEDMDRELKKGLASYDLEWHTRTGMPYSISDLDRVAAGSAQTVLLLQDGIIEDAGKRQVTTVMGVQTCRANVRLRPWQHLLPQNIVVQEAEKSNDDYMLGSAKSLVARSTQKLELTTLGGRRDMSMLLAQSAIQPGVASVYCTIVQQSLEDVEFYIRNFPQFCGKSFAVARRSFKQVVVCGYLRPKADQPLFLNPPDSDVLQKGDLVICLAQTGFFEPDADGRPILKQLDKAAGSHALRAPPNASEPDCMKAMPKKIIVAWYDHDMKYLVRSLGRFAPFGSEVIVICPNDLEGMPEKQAKGTPCHFRSLRGDPTQLNLVMEAGIWEADSLIVGGIEKEDPKEADTLLLSMLLVLEDALLRCPNKRKNPLHVIGLIRRAETSQVANYMLDRLGHGLVTAELLQPDELVSGMMAQIAADPLLAQLLTSFIYSSEGQEVYLRQPSYYQLPADQPCTFQQLSELCRLRQETAIGFIAKEGGVELSPRMTSRRAFCSSDRIIVLADSGPPSCDLRP